ncbi:MAG TPA: SulP family inorganic anion transporter [Cyclobacteriaceae bacterium]|jgi:MFS superfamily sulfate permease-like transporter|nr:SulP family inorganic anion transporter [Cyclobacteriaceae bacterium]
MNKQNFFRTDFLSSIVVFLIALPLCLGIALASGAPMFSGIIAGIIGGLLVGTLSGSQLSVSGPAAGLASIVIVSISQLGSFQAFLLSVAIAGIFQFTLGYLRAGSLGHFFPASVIKGMLAAIGLILVLKQVPHALGFHSDYEGDETFDQLDGANTFSEIVSALDFLTPGSIIITIVSIGILIVWDSTFIKSKQIFSKTPGPLVAVVTGVVLSLLFSEYLPALAINEKHFVALPRISDQGISSFLSLPDFSQLGNPKIYTVAITLAVIASLETMLSIEACDKLDPLKRVTPLNQELKAQGAGNFVSGLIGGLPITSVIVRSSANIQAGAHSRASAISHGLLLLVTVVLIPHVLQLIPLASLAGILIVTGMKLAKPDLFVDQFQRGWSQFLPFIVTVLGVIATNLLQGVIAGILVSVLFILKTNFHAAVIMVADQRNYLIVFTKDVSFLNKSSLRKQLQLVPRDSKLIIDGSKALFIDSDIREAIGDFIQFSRTKNINVELKSITL